MKKMVWKDYKARQSIIKIRCIVYSNWHKLYDCIFSVGGEKCGGFLWKGGSRFAELNFVEAIIARLTIWSHKFLFFKSYHPWKQIRFNYTLWYTDTDHLDLSFSNEYSLGVLW